MSTTAKEGVDLKCSCQFIDITFGTSSLKKVTRSLKFSRASRQLHVYASSYDWITRLSVEFVIGQTDYFGFGFSTFT